jgi:DNA invertase Pin-like site-specific DNA recombinase
MEVMDYEKKQMKEQPTQRKVVGYLRVSTMSQDLDKNKADILTYANNRKLGNVDFVEEIVS